MLAIVCRVQACIPPTSKGIGLKEHTPPCTHGKFDGIRKSHFAACKVNLLHMVTNAEFVMSFAPEFVMVEIGEFVILKPRRGHITPRPFYISDLDLNGARPARSAHYAI